MTNTTVQPETVGALPGQAAPGRFLSAGYLYKEISDQLGIVIEIYHANVGLDDHRSSIKWNPVTEHSEVRNIRPAVLRDGDTRRVLWNSGRFTAYTNYDMNKVGFIAAVNWN